MRTSSVSNPGVAVRCAATERWSSPSPNSSAGNGYLTENFGFRICPSYAPGSGINPVVQFEEYQDGNFIVSSRSLVAGWAVTEDADFEDSGELAAARLVACSDQVQATPNGTTCEFDGDGTPVTRELVDTVYELIVYEASTGELVGQATLEAASAECPFVVTYAPGDTWHMNEPTDDQFINALRPFVEG